MAINNKSQSTFEDDISLSEAIQLVKTNSRILLSFILLGIIVGGIFGKFSTPEYIGSMVLAPAKINGKLIEEPGLIITKLNNNNYYTKETFLACNPSHNKDEALNLKMSNIIKASILKDSPLIKLSITSKNKEFIVNCLNAIEADLMLADREFIDSYKKTLKELLVVLQQQIKENRSSKQELNALEASQLKMITFDRAIYFTALANNFINFETMTSQFLNLQIQLSPRQLQYTSRIYPINLERKDFPSTKLGLLSGLFLGAFLGLFVIFFRRIFIR
jgi:hypothetical protein